MAGLQNDINSTEKLLDVIRGKSNGSPEREKSLPSFPSKPASIGRNMSLPRFFSGKKNYTVGIDIGHDSIRLARTIRTSDGRPVLVDYKIINYNNDLEKGSPEFNELLKSNILSFCGSLANCNIWTMMTAADVNVHHLKIPRVPKKQLENAIYWSAKKDNPFDEKDYLFDYEIQGEITDQGIPKLSVMYYTAPKTEIEKVKYIFSAIGVELSGITIAPFAIQNIFRTKWMPAGEGNIASLFIGNDFSRIDIYCRESLVMTRGIKTGVTSMMEAIADNVNEAVDNNKKISKEEARKILFSLSPDSEKLNQYDAGFGLQEKEIFEMALPALERLARQVERTLEHYSSAVGFEKVEKVYISSVMNIYEPIINYISEQLGMKSEVFDPFRQHSTQIAESSYLSERISLVPVLGLSFSDNSRTSNFIYSYRQKNKAETIKNINKGIFAVTAVIVLACIIALIYQGMEGNSINDERAILERNLTQYHPIITSEMVTKIAHNVREQKQISRQYVDKYIGIALIEEISLLTPANIKLINLKINFGMAATSAAAKSEKETTSNTQGLIIEGLVFGERNILDSFLAQYIMKLENSPLLKQLAIQKSAVIIWKKGEALRFTLSAKTSQ